MLNPFTVLPSNITSPLRNMATFQCEQANSYPAPTITWFDTSNVKIVNEPSDRIHISPIGTLYIQNVEVGDAGKYTCQASNSAGVNITSAWLTVVDESMPNCKCHCRR